MEALDNKYAIELESIKGAIQSSDLLAAYLESEEEEDYQALRTEFEPSIDALYQRVATENPLQLISLERKLCDPGFEGLYLSRILGYSVLRGEVDDQYRYKRPQNHFKEILLAICNSSNFDYVKNRIGQSVQIGFGLSSDIWITNLIEQVKIRRVAQFLQEQVLQKYRDAGERQEAYARYSRQFSDAVFHCAEFPVNNAELNNMFPSLRRFLLHRSGYTDQNESLIPNIIAFLDNNDFRNTREYVQILIIFTNFYDFSGQKHWLKNTFNSARKENPSFEDQYFEFLEFLLNSQLEVDDIADRKVIEILDPDHQDALTRYYGLMAIIHTKGYIHDDSIEAVRTFYDQQEGLSTINECLRRRIFGHFRGLLSNLPESAYTDYFEFNKTFTLYMQLFNNQHFNQDVKKLSMDYVRRLLKKYTDKRGKDYQDIKKFVAQTFVDNGFLTEKEVIELFKTRRRKKAV